MLSTREPLFILSNYYDNNKHQRVNLRAHLSPSLDTESSSNKRDVVGRVDPVPQGAQNEREQCVEERGT